MSLRVLGMGDGQEAARVFAHGRGIEPCLLDSLPEVTRQISRSESPVLISLGGGIRFRDMAALMRRVTQQGVSCGFLDTWRSAFEAERHAAELVSWSSHLPPGCTLWLQDSDLSEMHGRYDDVNLLDVQADPAQSLLLSQRRILGLASHSNGVDAPLGQSLLCGLLAWSKSPPLTRYLPCGFGGPCRGLRMSEDGVWRNPNLIEPSQLIGDVLILGVCDGVLMADGRFDPAGGLLNGLLKPGSIRQVITTYKHWPMDEASLLAACLIADSGTPLGEIVLMLNRAYLDRASSNGDPPWLLIGDPSSCVTTDAPLPRPSLSSALDRGRAGVADGGTAGPDRVVLVDGSPETAEERLWISPVAAGSLVVWLRDDVRTGMTASVVPAAEDPAHQTLRRIWSSGGRLTALHSLLDQAHSAPGNFHYDRSLSGRVGPVVERLQLLSSSEGSPVRLSGRRADITAIAETEAASWALLHDGLQTAVIELAMNSASFRDCLATPTRVGAWTEGSCPYCGLSTSASRYGSPRFAATRRVVFCDRCQLISDSDDDTDGGHLHGPDRVLPGVPATYEAVMDRWPARGIQEFRGALIIRQLLPTLNDVSPCAGLSASPVRQDLTLTWTPSPELAPGGYNLTAALLIDASPVLLRRPIIVAEPPDHEAVQPAASYPRPAPSVAGQQSP